MSGKRKGVLRDWSRGGDAGTRVICKHPAYSLSLSPSHSRRCLSCPCSHSDPRHYYAGNMALVLVSRDSLDVLEGHVRDKFGAIRDREPLAVRKGDVERTAAVRFNNPFQTRVLPPASNPTPSDGQRNALCPSTPSPSYTISGDDDPSTGRLPFVAPLGLGAGMDRCPAVPLIRIVPLRDKKEIRVTWPLPPSRPSYRAPPTRLLSHLLGHEGEGSIFSVLHRAGWASGVHAGLGTSQDDFCLFEVTVALTEEGLPHWQDVASLIFQYVHLVGRASPGKGFSIQTLCPVRLFSAPQALSADSRGLPPFSPPLSLCFAAVRRGTFGPLGRASRHFRYRIPLPAKVLRIFLCRRPGKEAPVPSGQARPERGALVRSLGRGLPLGLPGPYDGGESHPNPFLQGQSVTLLPSASPGPVSGATKLTRRARPRGTLVSDSLPARALPGPRDPGMGLCARRLLAPSPP